MSSQWHLDLAGAVARLSLDRPGARNAINLAMWAELPSLLQEIAADRACRLLVLRGEGNAFSSGGDIEEFHNATAQPALAGEIHARMQAGLAALAAFSLPSIAALEGPVIGPGLALALACDLRIAAPDARLAITPAKLGLSFALPDLVRLEALIGPAKAKLMLFTARAICAQTALAWGLIDEIAAPSLDAALGALEADLLARSPATQRGLKGLFTLHASGQREESAASQGLFTDAFQSQDFQEGYRAFKAKRDPRF